MIKNPLNTVERNIKVCCYEMAKNSLKMFHHGWEKF